ncbi:MAG: DUF2391 family protein [Nanoarchaeota archaeon]|nr:DUF2391 family protein [Nanoarchaeota archaeon]MBU0962820.1 DUF2391 family protein [Nanoarchaeota archaeon]
MPKKKVKKDRLSKIENKIDEVLRLEKIQLKEQDDVEVLERKQLRELGDLEELQKKIQKEVGEHPLRKITIRDISKGVIGAFIGIVSHFAFFEGAHIAEDIHLFRAVLLLVTSYFLSIIFIYLTGYRKIKQTMLLYFLPLRSTVIFFTALVVIVFVLFIYGIVEHSSIDLIFRQVAVISLPAVIGASAADLIGGE